MRKRFFAICSVPVAAILLMAMVPGCIPTTGTIEVDATLDGSPWSGVVQYTLTGPGITSPITGSSVPDSHTGQAGNWTCAYVSGGPPEADLIDITPTATQTVAADGTIKFTMNFEQREQATIEVEATLCGEVYEGAMAYTLSATGEDPQNGTVAPNSHTVAPGEWTCEATFGPPGAILIDITPDPTQTVADGGSITFTINFDQGQDAEVNFITWTIDGQPAEFYNYLDPEPITHVVDYGSVIDVHFEQVVHGCDQHVAVVNETAGLLIFRLNWMEGLGPDLEPMPFLIHGVNDDCAVNKTGDPPADKAQGSQELIWWNNTTPVSMDYCDEEEILWLSKNTSELLLEYDLSKGLLFEESSLWTVAKNVPYTKSINWLSVIPDDVWGEPEEDNVLLHLVPAVAQFPHMFLAMAFLSVEIQDAEDINPANNGYEGYYSPLVFWVPNAP